MYQVDNLSYFLQILCLDAVVLDKQAGHDGFKNAKDYEQLLKPESLMIVRKRKPFLKIKNRQKLQSPCRNHTCQSSDTNPLTDLQLGNVIAQPLA